MYKYEYISFKTQSTQSPDSSTPRTTKLQSRIIRNLLNQALDQPSLSPQQRLLKRLSPLSIPPKHNLNPSRLNRLIIQHHRRLRTLLPSNLPILLRHLPERVCRQVIRRVKGLSLTFSEPDVSGAVGHYHVAGGFGEDDVGVVFVGVDR